LPVRPDSGLRSVPASDKVPSPVVKGEMQRTDRLVTGRERNRHDTAGRRGGRKGPTGPRPARDRPMTGPWPPAIPAIPGGSRHAAGRRSGRCAARSPAPPGARRRPSLHRGGRAAEARRRPPALTPPEPPSIRAGRDRPRRGGETSPSGPPFGVAACAGDEATARCRGGVRGMRQAAAGGPLAAWRAAKEARGSWVERVR